VLAQEHARLVVQGNVLDAGNHRQIADQIGQEFVRNSGSPPVKPQLTHPEAPLNKARQPRISSKDSGSWDSGSGSSREIFPSACNRDSGSCRRSMTEMRKVRAEAPAKFVEGIAGASDVVNGVLHGLFGHSGIPLVTKPFGYGVGPTAGNSTNPGRAGEAQKIADPFGGRGFLPTGAPPLHRAQMATGREKYARRRLERDRGRRGPAAPAARRLVPWRFRDRWNDVAESDISTWETGFPASRETELALPVRCPNHMGLPGAAGPRL